MISITQILEELDSLIERKKPSHKSVVIIELDSLEEFENELREMEVALSERNRVRTPEEETAIYDEMIEEADELHQKLTKKCERR